MRKGFMILLIVVLVLSISGCGVRRKIEDKIGEAITEKIIESASGQKVDISGDKITLKGEDSGSVTFGANEWPKSDIVKNIPVFKGGNITSSIDGEDGVMIIVEDVASKDFEDYLAKIKKDFTENVYEVNSEDLTAYTAENGKNVMVYLTYENSDEILSIMLSKAGE